VQIGDLCIRDVPPPLPEHAAGRAVKGAAAAKKKEKKEKLKALKMERTLRRERNVKRQGHREKGEIASSDSDTSVYSTAMEESEDDDVS